jgi:hypothetical protein
MQIIPVSEITFRGSAYKAGRNAAKRVMNDIQRDYSSARKFEINDMQADEAARRTRNKANRDFKREVVSEKSKAKRLDYKA